MTHTRSEILAMPAEQLRIEIARKKGAIWLRRRMQLSNTNLCTLYFGKKGENRDIPLSWYVENPEPGDEVFIVETIPDYPNDIAAAWGLVEEFLAAGCEVTLSSETRSDNKLWYVTRFDFRGDGKGTGYTMVGCWYAHTAPLAISRAWLIWSKESGK